MALKAAPIEHARTVTHVSHEALVPVGERVKDILARREAALRQARLEARRLKRP
jgi:hypothetical protein